VNGCKDKENREGFHSGIPAAVGAGGATVVLHPGTVVIPPGVAAQIAAAGGASFLPENGSAQIPQCGPLTRWCPEMGFCVDISTDNFLEMCQSEVDVNDHWSCENYKTDHVACLNTEHSEWCYWDPRDGCKDREDLEHRFYTVVGASSYEAAISANGVTGSGLAVVVPGGGSATVTGSAPATDNGSASPLCTPPFTRFCPELGVCVSILSDNFLERCLSEHDVGPELTCEDWAFNHEVCAAHAEWCYFDPIAGCKDKETIGLTVLQKTHAVPPSTASFSALGYALTAVFFSSLSFFIVTTCSSNNAKSHNDKNVYLI